MSKPEEITVRPDAKGRITLGAFAKGISSFRATKEKDGKIVLEPFVEIPAREHWIFKNPEALAALEQGLADSAAGRIHYLGDFSQYANDDDLLNAVSPAFCRSRERRADQFAKQRSFAEALQGRKCSAWQIANQPAPSRPSHP